MVLPPKAKVFVREVISTAAPGMVFERAGSVLVCAGPVNEPPPQT